jgi:hypothetical protein
MEVYFQNLRKEMKAKGETYEYLGKLLNIHSESVRRKMAGITDWTLGEVEILCKHYETDDMWYLFKNKTKVA